MATVTDAPRKLTDSEARIQATLDLCQKDFAAFVGFVVHPWKLYAHQRIVCDTLQGVEAKPDARQIVVLPFGHGKTEIGGVPFGAWCLGRGHTKGPDGNPLGPIDRIGFASASADFAATQSASMRDFFRPGGPGALVFPQCELHPDGMAAEEWRFKGCVPNHPCCKAVGVGGQFQGRRVNLLLCDDLLRNFEEAQSENARNKVWNWFSADAITRVLAGGKAALLGTRGHADDLPGRLIERNEDGEWGVLHLPGVLDIDTPQAHALCPELRTLKSWYNYREKYGPRAFNTLCMGTPTPDKGEVWDRQWFDGDEHNDRRYAPGKAPDPADCETWIAVDTAEGRTKDHDYVGLCRGGRDKSGHKWIFNTLKLRCTREALGEAIAAMRSTGSEGVVIESGARCQWLRDTLSSLGIGSLPMTIPGNKVDKAKSVRPEVEMGMVHVSLDAQGEELVRTCCAFPHDNHDDQHDAFVLLLQKLREATPFYVGFI